jgi:hypothetical protein
LPENHVQENAPLTKRTARSNKRCGNALLVESGYVFRYPSFKEGYAPLLKVE